MHQEVWPGILHELSHFKLQAKYMLQALHQRALPRRPRVVGKGRNKIIIAHCCLGRQSACICGKQGKPSSRDSLGLGDEGHVLGIANIFRGSPKGYLNLSYMEVISIAKSKSLPTVPTSHSTIMGIPVRDSLIYFPGHGHPW